MRICTLILNPPCLTFELFDNRSANSLTCSLGAQFAPILIALFGETVMYVNGRQIEAAAQTPP